MVIVVMGDVKSDRDRVAALLAEFLEWEFLDIEKQSGWGGMSSSMIDAQGCLRMELLRAAVDSLIYEWRDVVLSCQFLTEKDQKHLRDNRSVVKFVHLKAADATDAKLRFNPSAEMRICGPVNATQLTPKYDNGVLILPSSMEIAQIVNAVLSGAILQKSGGP